MKLLLNAQYVCVRRESKGTAHTHTHEATDLLQTLVDRSILVVAAEINVLVDAFGFVFMLRLFGGERRTSEKSRICHKRFLGPVSVGTKKLAQTRKRSVAGSGLAPTTTIAQRTCACVTHTDYELNGLEKSLEDQTKRNAQKIVTHTDEGLDELRLLVGVEARARAQGVGHGIFELTEMVVHL